MEATLEERLDLVVREGTPELNSAASMIPPSVRPSKSQLLDAVVEAKERQRRAEIDQVALVSALCDAYACLEPNPGGDIDDHARVLFGEELIPPSFEGVGPVAEFLGHELGPALGVSPDSAWSLVWDVLALRHRHPILWNQTLMGRVPVWLARKVASRCTSLSADAARQLDSQIGPVMPGWGPVKTMTEVNRWRCRLDPQAEDRRQRALRERHVTVAPHPSLDGIAQVEAALDAVDARHLSVTLDALATALRRAGTEGTAHELRAVALGQLAHPERAARLLGGDPGTGECRHGAELVVHLTGADLVRGAGGDVEGIGPLTRGHLDNILRGCAGRVTVRPVADLTAPAAIAAYRPSPEITWRVKTRDVVEAFPYSQRSARSSRIDLDHTIPYARGGPTCVTNLGPLSRRTHRAKTHGGFTVTIQRPGVFRWTTPLGKTYWTSAHGTWTEPPPSTVTTDPHDTTCQVLGRVLRAAAAGHADYPPSQAVDPPT